MSEQWITVTLGEVADFINGYPFKPDELTGRGLPVIRIKQLLDATAKCDLSDAPVPSRHRVNDGDLIFSWSGTLASHIWDRGPALLNQHLFRVVERPGVLRGWLHLALDNAVEDLAEKTHGTTMKHVTKKVLEGHSLWLPPIAVQRRIVDLIGSMDAQIKALEREGEAAVIVEAALRRSLLGAVEGTECTLGDVTEFAGGYAFPHRYQGTPEGEFPFIKVSDMNTAENARRMETAVNWVSAATLEQMRARCWPPGTVIFPKVGAALLTEKRRILGRPAAFDNNIMGLIPGKQLLPAFLLAVLTEVKLGDMAQHGAVPSVNQGHLRGMPIRVPTLEVQREICADLEAAYGVAQAIQLEADRLRAFRLRLLSAVLSGEMTLPESYEDLLETAS